MRRLLICVICCHRVDALDHNLEKLLKEKRVRLLVCGLSLLLLTACAYSPQQLQLAPSISAEQQSYGAGQAIEVAVDDQRASKVLGSRGGAYPDTSLITLADNFTEVLVNAGKATLAAQGFNVNPTQAGDAQFKIIVDTLDYQKPERSVGSEVHLVAVLRAEINSGGESYSARYQTRSEQLMAWTASTARNEEMVNAVVSNTLERMFGDEKLRAFLSNI
jgi:uncharacterized lipoprotein